MLKDIADSRIEIDSCRLLCLQAASMMDSVGNKLAAQQIGTIKVLAPSMALRVIDRASNELHGQLSPCDTHCPLLVHLSISSPSIHSSLISPPLFCLALVSPAERTKQERERLEAKGKRRERIEGKQGREEKGLPIRIDM
jgi:alkylation response protein AidB-like acyl-CoA dehydrogenase